MPEPNVTKTVPTLPRVVGGFRLVRELGRGGMGVVYHAEELSSGRVVALKVLAADQAVSEEAFERFRRESRMAASISDSRCVFVYGAHQVDGSPAIAMELCPGETLEHRLAKHEPIPIELAVRWTLEILEGLEAAHRAGVVHRDVKPSNCFITEDGHVKIGDFGLSRSLDTDIRLTQSGAFLGSPLYASPEQIRGRDVDLRSDIYSCGATLYALLGGRAPYHGQNIGEVLARILSEAPPSLSSLRPEVPADLEKVVVKAMEREPDRRFQDHASFRAALDPFVGGEVVAGSRVKRVVAFALDEVMMSAIGAGLMFTAVSKGWRWAEMDPDRPGQVKSIGAQLLIGAIPAVYFALSEGLLGASAAKWMLGLRVVNARTRQVDLRRCLLRVLVFSGPALLAFCLLHNLRLSQRDLGLWINFAGLTNFLVLASSMRRRNGYRGLHELASGTRVVQARSPFAPFQDTRPVPRHATESADRWPEQIGVYKIESLVGSTPTGAVLQGVDQDLNRPVWIHVREHGAGESSEARHSLARPGRLRWLDSIRHADTVYEAFEAPGGASLAACIAERGTLDWPTAHRLLTGLADEFAELAAPRESTELRAPGNELGAVCLEQLWVDRNWHPRLLDEPLGQGSLQCKPPLELLADAARLMLQDRAHPEAILPASLPGFADPVVRKLLGHDEPYSSAERVRRDLASLAGRPMSVSLLLRAMQIASCAIVPFLALGAAVVTLFAFAEPIDRLQESARCIRQLEAQDASPPPAELMDEEDRRAREIVISEMPVNLFSSNFISQLEPEQIAVRDRALSNQPSPTAAELEWARERIRERPFPQRASDARSAGEIDARLGPQTGVQVSVEEKRSIKQVRWLLIPMFTAWTIGTWGVLATLFAAIFQGGLTLRLFGIAVRSRRGEMASRWRCAWRSLLVWVPAVAVYWLAARLALGSHVTAGIALTIVAAVLHALALAYAIGRPSRGMQDRLAGTYLVPR
jgi:uncharacterized RDD family membrane protein YckC